MSTQTDALAALLSESERAEIQALVQHASAQGAEAFSWWSPQRGLVLIGFAADGELLTWFASPARNPTEAAAIRAVVTTGVQLAAQAVQDFAATAAAAADELLTRVRH